MARTAQEPPQPTRPTTPQASNQPSQIVIRGARTHNLKALDLDLDKNQLVVVTGPSGSGKSSLAFDTLAAEGQRRYLESLSIQLRQLATRLERPPCDLLTGLPPTIAIGQDRVSYGPRQTLGTLTEVSDHLRILFARAGTLHCPDCDRPVERHTPAAIVERILAHPEGSRFSLLAPVIRDRPIDQPTLTDLASQGFLRVRLDGTLHELAELTLPKKPKARQTLEVVIDRLIVKDGLAPRLFDSLETALRVGKGVVSFAPHVPEGTTAPPELRFSTLNRCDNCELDLPELSPRLLSPSSPDGACPTCQGLPTMPACAACDGTRLNPVARKVRLSGTTLPELQRLPLSELDPRLRALTFTAAQRLIATGLLREAHHRLAFLVVVGLGYLTLEHPADALSTGESSRVRLAAQLGPELSGVLYVLDEPTRGLHPADSASLVAALRGLVTAGNTVIVVEHDPAVIAAADLVVDLGPGAGAEGGELLAALPPDALAASPRSVTGPWLSGSRRIPEPPSRPAATDWLTLSNINIHNLQSLDVRIPINRLTSVVGRSASGKSTLVMHALEPALRAALEGDTQDRPTASRLAGHQRLEKVVTIDQAPIGRSPRSNPATFTKVFDEIRTLFAATKDAKARGFTASRFSFNAAGGRCEACDGDGQLKVEMHLLPDVWVTCERCQGRRYNDATLSVRYKGLDIAEILAMTVSELRPIFAPVSKIARVLDTLHAVGLGYLRLGQPAQTLSGGESQRLKLARELARPETGQTIYLLDEPSAGLHFVDLERLVDVLWRLVDRGNTVVLVDHRLPLVTASDWVLELGPGAGLPSRVLFAGPPADLARTSSPTGLALAELITRPA